MRLIRVNCIVEVHHHDHHEYNYDNYNECVSLLYKEKMILTLTKSAMKNNNNFN